MSGRRKTHRTGSALNTRNTAIGTGLALGLGLALAACSGQAEETAAPADGRSRTPAPSGPASEVTGEDGVVGTIVHFTAGSTVVEVTIREDTPTTRDFLSMLPMTLPFEDYAGQEKIAYLERALDYAGSEAGMTPEVGDLFSYKPWGNLGFFTGVDGLGHSTDLVRIGATDDLDAVMLLDGQDVTIAVAG